jgi:hypothetical protein
MEFVFDRRRDFRLRCRIVDLLRGATLRHGASVVPILGRLAESEDLDPLPRAIARSSFAEALDRTARGECHRAAGGPDSSGTSDEASADPGECPATPPVPLSRPLRTHERPVRARDSRLAPGR